LLAVECKNHTKSREEENEKAVVIVQGQLMDPVCIHICIYTFGVEKKTMMNEKKKMVAAFLFFFLLSASVE
jgi:hypothetical protein